MFTIPAIRHTAVKVEDESMGTMHLNALNGSSNVLGCNDSTSKSDRNIVFGGLIGASLSNNHPYRPHDSGMTFHQTSQYSHKKSAASSSIPSTPSAQDKPSPISLNFNSKRKDSAPSLGTSEPPAPTGPRRRSLDLDLVSANSHRRYEDRPLSLDELVIGPFSRLGRFLDHAIDEQDQTSDPDNPGLSVTEISISTTSTHGSAQVTDGLSACSQTKRKRSKKTKAHTTDSVMSERALRFLGKVKDNRKDHNSNFQQGRHISEDSHKDYHPHSDTTRMDNSQHIFHHLLTSSGQQSLEPGGH